MNKVIPDRKQEKEEVVVVKLGVKKDQELEESSETESKHS
jgi:hypothetical protein